MKKSIYYSIESDLKKYPRCSTYIVVGGRGTGKTYGSLKYCYENKIKFVFVKRTNEDVKLLCSGSGHIGSKQAQYGFDMSPFKALNRDMNINVKAMSIFDGLGGFWNCDTENEPIGEPIGYIVSLNVINKVKGFDLSDCDVCIFDEFIPLQYERVNRNEGYMVLDLYKTISRDREIRGQEPLKLVCLANATRVSNPVMNTFEITDVVVQMQLTGQASNYIEEKGIFIHLLSDNADFHAKEEQSAIYKAMKGTSWAKMSLDNEFAYDDFSSVEKIKLKQFSPVCRVKYKENHYYIYVKEGLYYMTKSRHMKGNLYNLNKENDQKLFYRDYDIDLRNACIENNMIFETYTMYDLIVNYKQFFKL